MVLGGSFALTFYCFITQIPDKSLCALFPAKGDESEDAKQPTSDSKPQALPTLSLMN